MSNNRLTTGSDDATFSRHHNCARTEPSAGRFSFQETEMKKKGTKKGGRGC